VIGGIADVEAGGVPDFVGKVAVRFDARDAEFHVVAGRAAGEQAEAQRIGAVFVDQIQRIHYIAEALAHLTTRFVAHEAVQIDGVERPVNLMPIMIMRATQKKMMS